MTRTETAAAIVAMIDTMEASNGARAIRAANAADLLAANCALVVVWTWAHYPALSVSATFGIDRRTVQFFADAPRARSAYEAKLLGAWLTELAGAVECLENTL